MRQNARTDPELAYWIEKYLLFRGTLSFTSLVDEDTFASTDVRVAAVGQDLIGWTEFLHGKVSVEIAAIQNLHCMSSPSCRLTGADWMKAFISHLPSNLPFPVDIPELYSARQTTGLPTSALTLEGSARDTQASRDPPVRGSARKPVPPGNRPFRHVQGVV
jgi:hypothetical protein